MDALEKIHESPFSWASASPGVVPEPCAFTRTKVYSLQSMDQGSISEIKELLDMYSKILGLGGVFFWRDLSL